MLDYREEDSHVDFKEHFHPEHEKEWLEITKDVMAFANTFGGYLVFGIQDKTFEISGLDAKTVECLVDTNQVLQKLNRFQEPPFTGVRTKACQIDNKTVVILCVPPSKKYTHIFSQDGKYRFPSGKADDYVFRRGTLFVRQTAGNHLVDAHDLSAIVERRLEDYRGALMEKIAKVVEAPIESEIVLLSQGDNGENAKSFIISNDPKAIPVQGMSFSISPKTYEEKVAAWVAVSRTDVGVVPTQSFMWQCYQNRSSVVVDLDLRTELAKFSILTRSPAFYWLRGLPSEVIKTMLDEIASRGTDLTRIGYLWGISAFLGRTFHKALTNKSNKIKDRHNSEMFTFPKDPSSLVGLVYVEAERKLFKGTDLEFREHVNLELDARVADFVSSGEGHLDVVEVLRAQAFDCFLYAQHDKYNPKIVNEVLDGNQKKLDVDPPAKFAKLI